MTLKKLQLINPLQFLVAYRKKYCFIMGLCFTAPGRGCDICSGVTPILFPRCPDDFYVTHYLYKFVKTVEIYECTRFISVPYLRVYHMYKCTLCMSVPYV